MFNSSYLCLSRHNIYYLRFPIPPALHQQGKARDIKLSLQTLCPQEALYLARTLVYFGDTVINNSIVHNIKKLEERISNQEILTDENSKLKNKLDEREKAYSVKTSLNQVIFMLK